ncbi:MAG TPA: hypothetical protein VKT80_16520, partial [Chloroflexota bacterium]|nr:hypothetical protein [Chloroflexota bacterium]
AVTVLEQVQSQVGVWLDPDGIDHLWHAIAAHHGTWGMITPHTPEAWLLHQCDNYSAMHHRIAPIDANDILPLTVEGYSWTQIGERLGVNRSVVKARLVESCRAEGLRTPTDLVDRWRERGYVGAGDPDRIRQIERARLVVEFARRCPVALIDKVREVLPVMSEPVAAKTQAAIGPLVVYPNRTVARS